MPKAPRRKAERFPLTLHGPTRQWCKNFTLPNGRRRLVYFGTNRDAALTKYVVEREDWQAGRNPREAVRPTASAVTLADLINSFLSRSEQRVSDQEISPVTFADHLWVGKQMTEQFGRNRDPLRLTPMDFAGFRAAIAAKYAPSRLTKTIVVCRGMFKWAFDSELLPTSIRFGPDFKVAGKRRERTHKAAAGAKLLTANEIRATLGKADATLQAMIYLGINGGMGNADIAALPLEAVDLKGAMIDFPRPKTGVARRIPLWPETIKALRKVLASRKPRPEFGSLVFVTARGGPWVNVKPTGKRVDQIIELFRDAATEAKVHRPRMGFYWLRHTFQTIGDEALDPIATAFVMGHADATIGGIYRESISDDRLRSVTDHVRQWLFAKSTKKAVKPKAKPRAKR